MKKNKVILLLGFMLSSFGLMAKEGGIDAKIDSFFSEYISGPLMSVVFYTFDLEIAGEEIKIPYILLWLVLGALFCTFYFKFVNIRNFKTSIDIVRGKYEDPDEKGEVSHFQALTAALSGTVGLGNIGGVAVAVSLGGPGATFWMIMAGFLGMSSKFAECTLGVKYREIAEDGTVYGLSLIHI